MPGMQTGAVRVSEFSHAHPINVSGNGYLWISGCPVDRFIIFAYLSLSMPKSRLKGYLQGSGKPYVSQRILMMSDVCLKVRGAC